MQLRVGAQLVLETDISLQALRKALLIIRDRKLIDHDHPLATSRFKTDGRGSSLRSATRPESRSSTTYFEASMRSTALSRRAFKDVDRNFEITRWWPLGRDRTVVVDPQRSFGAPIASQSGIPTATLALAAEREGSVRAVTRWYRVTEREVRDAIAFEQRLTRTPEPQMAA